MSDSATPASPYWLNRPQDWAVNQLRQHHNEALFLLGESAVFVMLWTTEDHENSLVDKCGICWYAQGDSAQVYEQTSNPKCPRCYGTTFEGGIKAQLVRPSVWEFIEPEDEEESRRGLVTTQTATIQTSPDVKLRKGDFVIRADNSRWQIQSLAAMRVRTGFALPNNQTSLVGGSHGRAVREEGTSVAYLIPPISAEDLALTLDGTLATNHPSVDIT